jgi:hypothetical protein
MKRPELFSVSWITAALVASFCGAAEKGIFDYAGQLKAGDDVIKIVFIADAGTHGGPGNHEFMAGSMLLARELNAFYPNAWAVVHSSNNWPKELSHVDAVIVALNHGGRAAEDSQIFEAVRKGAGFMAIHFGVEVNKGKQGDNYADWMGGYFETFWSVNPWWQPKFEKFPDHPIAHGVKPFSVRDEWYYHMRFVDDLKGVTPILSDVPPTNTASDKPSDRGGNPAVFKEVSEGKPQHVAWAYDRPDGGRGFGFTGLHDHFNLADDSFRTVLLNAVAWVSKLEVPADGVPSKTPTKDELTSLITEAKQAITDGR